MGGGFVLELGKFGVNRGVIGEVTNDEGRRGVGVNAGRGDARWEVGAETFPEAVGLKVAGTEFSPVLLRSSSKRSRNRSSVRDEDNRHKVGLPCLSCR